MTRNPLLALVLAVPLLLGVGGFLDHAQAADNPAGPVDIVDEATPLDDCFMCGGGSSGPCGPQSGKSRIQCHGSRVDCRERGCRITGTASCSSAANVGNC